MNPANPPESDEHPDAQVRDAVGAAPIVVDRRALQQISAHVRADTSVEHGGVLVGSVAADGTVDISSAIPAEHAVSHASSLTFTHETWEQINDALERDHPGKRIVGWYHSHPGFSVFLSEYDTFIHRNFFAAPWQVAYVVDPLIDEEGFFGWADDAIVRYPEWRIRAHAGRGGAAVDAPAHREPRSADVRSRRGFALLLATGLGAVLLGLIAGIMLTRSPDDDPELSAVPLVRRDGLVQNREVTLRDGCLVVRLVLTNPSDVPAERLRVVDPLPQQLHGAASCDGSRQMTDRFEADGGTLGAGDSVPVEYRIALPEGTAESRATLAAWDQEHRAQWARFKQAEPNLEIEDFALQLGTGTPVPLGERFADGSLLPVDSWDQWSIERPEIASLVNGQVWALSVGTTELRRGDSVVASITVTVASPPTSAAPTATTAPDHRTIPPPARTAAVPSVPD